METCNSGGFFAKQRWFFITGMSFVLLLPPENEFLQKFWTKNVDDNEEFTNKVLRKNFMWSL